MSVLSLGGGSIRVQRNQRGETRSLRNRLDRRGKAKKVRVLGGCICCWYQVGKSSSKLYLSNWLCQEVTNKPNLSITFITIITSYWYTNTGRLPIIEQALHATNVQRPRNTKMTNVGPCTSFYKPSCPLYLPDKQPIIPTSHNDITANTS